jgi:hypothetical protein
MARQGVRGQITGAGEGMRAQVIPLFPEGAEEAGFVQVVLDYCQFMGKRPPCWCGEKGAARLTAAGVPSGAIRHFVLCPKHGRRRRSTPGSPRVRPAREDGRDGS